jgi:hypothetical protein
VDAYTRLDNGVVNETNLAKVFLGDIKYDGTGYKGDGVATNGNIVLGGLGADTILGGIGNDFLASGGVALSRGAATESLAGGRNADFLFAELSLLSNTDGNKLFLDGGATADNTSAATGQSAQDSDWLLLQASDDDERIEVVLSEDAGSVGTAASNDGSLVTRAGQYATLKDIENVDASGNMYGFLKNLSTTVGGAPTGATNVNNNGIGSSGQLNITGSVANNIIIGGYHNDFINADAGNDLIMGGNLNNLIDPNLVGLVGNNNGRDEMFGGAGNDNIVFEADGGIIEGDVDPTINDAVSSDTLWLTRESLGIGATATATAMTKDGVLRFDLLAENLDDAAGYGGADAGTHDVTYNDTQDQTNYNATYAANRVQVRDMESVIVTGLGAVDYKAAGANTAADLTFDNQQNHFDYKGDVSLRGTGGVNTLYANTGADTVEGRTGNDLLSGGDGVDNFIFNLNLGGDGLDVIWRQKDAESAAADGTAGKNLWDVNADGTGDGAIARISLGNQAGLMTGDFGQSGDPVGHASYLTVDFSATNLAAANIYLSAFSVKVGTTVLAVTDLAALKLANNASDVALLADAAFKTIDANISVTATGNVLTVKDSTVAGGRVMAGNEVITAATDFGTSVTNPIVAFSSTPPDVARDRLVFAAYQDRADGELVDDAAIFGGDSLGANAYAQDLVIGFGVGGSTVIAENQAFKVDLTNLAVEDKVSVIVNGVTFNLTVGKELDNSLIANETTAAFAARLSTYIGTYLDNDTAAGKVLSGTYATTGANNGSFVLTQEAYAGEETVFMQVSVDVKDNSSNGQGAVGTVTNQSATDITLYQFDGRDAGLSAATAIFVGDSGVGPDGTTYSENSRAILATAKTAGGVLNGSDAIVINVSADGKIASSLLQGVGAKAISFNATQNPTTGETTNYAVHGDDQLIGGAGADAISAGTGDDRVYGSAGLDKISGGKNLYIVDSVIQVLNAYEATVEDAKPTVLDIRMLGDKDGNNAIDAGLSAEQTTNFNDTLIYQQSDFGAVGVGGAAFNIGLDLSTDQKTGGSGHVITNSLAANTTLFTNMENIRTVSGNGTWAGQGNDTIDLSKSNTINETTWVEASVANDISTYYDLTKGANAGKIWLDRDTLATAGAWPSRYESFVTTVDGVENVVTGGGTDALVIDQTEAGKNNSFTAGLGDDSITYLNTGNELTIAQLGTLTLTVGLGTTKANGTDTLVMSGGMMGVDTPVDTLIGVEAIDTNVIAVNSSEADVLNVAAMAAGATVTFGGATGTIHNGAAVAANLQATVTGLTQYEIVNGSTAGDTVIVSDTMTNAREDSNATVKPAVKVLFDSYLNYDVVDETVSAALDATTVPNRMSIAALRAGNFDASIPEVRNTSEYTFNLGDGTDRVDYSAEVGAIAVVVKQNETRTNVLVSQANDGNYSSDSDRIDVLSGVEQIVAARGASILDFTQFGQAVNIDFQYSLANATVLAAGDTVENTIRIANASGNEITGLTGFVERYITATTTVPAVTATWNTIQGSDFAEVVSYNGSENLIGQRAVDHRYSTDLLNLRGSVAGAPNVVSYNKLETSVAATVTVNEWTGAGTGTISADVKFLDGSSSNIATNKLTGSGTHTINSYTSDNQIALGSNLKIEASQDAEDIVTFASSSSKVFVLGTSPGVLNVNIGALNTMVMTGFEFLGDAATSDVYQFSNMITGLTLQDNATGDHDTIRVGDAAAVALYNGGIAPVAGVQNTIALTALNTYFNAMDFDVLDVTAATVSNLVLTGTADVTTDEVVVGALSKVTTITNFESVVLTDTSVLAGVVFNLDTTTNKLTQGSTSVNFGGTDNTNNVLSFGGTAFERELGSSNVAAVAAAVTVTATGAEGVEFIGGAGADTLTGAGGDDKLVGGAGNDVLNGGVAAEKVTFNLQGNLSPAASLVLDFMNAGTAFSTFTEGAAADFVAGAGNDAIGIAIAARFSGNLVATNAAYDALTTTDITSVTYDSATDQLVFNFAAGVNVANNMAFTIDTADSTNAAPISLGTFVDGGTGGNNTLRGGAGADTVNGGAGADTLVVVGSTTTAQAAAYAIAYATQTAVNTVIGGVTNVIARTELTTVGGSAATDVATGDVYNGGAGNDTLHIFGTADMTGSTINADIEVVSIHSAVTITYAQLQAMTAAGTKINFDTAGSTLTITGLTGSVAALDLSIITGVAVTVVLPAAVTGVVNLTAPAGVTLNNGSAITASGTTTVSNAIFGTGGDDLVAALTGTVNADIIYALAGNDTVLGGLGGDTIYLGTGNDVLKMTTGADSGAITVGTAAVTVGLAAPTTGTLMGAAGSWDVVYNFGAGDAFNFVAPTFGNSQPVLTNGSTMGAAAAGSVVLLKGSYAAATGFTVGSSGATDSLYVYDADGTGGGTTFNAVVLVGYVDTTSNDAQDTTGLTGFGG